MSESECQDLAQRLQSLAHAIQSGAVHIVGQEINVHVSAGTTGNLVGLKVEAIAHPGSSGTIIGNQVSVHVGGGNDVAAKLAQELKDAASLVKDGKAPKSWVVSLLDRVGSLGNRAIEASIVSTAKSLAEKILT